MKILYSLVLVAVIAFCAIMPAFAQEALDLGDTTGNETPVVTPEPTPDPTPRPRITPIPVPTPKSIYDIPVDLQVTDTQIKKSLIEMNINPVDVMLFEDYSVEHPTVQKYIDLKSKQTIAVIQTLPQINQNGEKIIPGWVHYIDGMDWQTLPNLFKAKVDGTRVTIIADGKVQEWNPRLYLNDKEIKPLSSTAILVDDIWNDYYHGNTLEWDYGICNRYIRVIEGFLQERWIFQENPGGEIKVQHNSSAGMDLELGLLFTGIGMPQQIEVKDDYEIVSSDTFKEIIYPATLGASMSFSPVNATDAWFEENLGGCSAWAPLRNAASATSLNSNLNSSGAGAGYYLYGGCVAGTRNLAIWRSGFMLDTIALNDAGVITGATFSLYGWYKVDEAGQAPDSSIYSATYAGTTSFVTADYSAMGIIAYATAKTYAAFSTTGYNTWTFNASGIAAINKMGITKLAYRESTHDAENNIPPDVPPGGSYYMQSFGIYYNEVGAGKQPLLVVTYTPAIPDIASNGASSIGMSSARLNGVLVDDGGELNSYRVGYGTTSKTVDNFPLYDTVTAWSDYSYDTGDNLYLDVSGLSPNTLYYYRFQTKNTVGNDTSDELTFTTLNSIVAPTDFIANPSATSILLSFSKGIGATDTIIRYAYDTYPTIITGGDLAGNTTGTFVTHSPLLSGKTVYYSAWSVSGGNTSTDYATVVGTTLLAGIADWTADTPELPTGFSQDPDYTAFSGLPGYGGINSLADTMAVPRATAWLIIQFAIIMGLTIAIGLVAGASIGVIAGIGAGVGFVIMGGMPSGFLMILGLFAVAYGIWRVRAA